MQTETALRVARNAAGLTQKELADKAGINIRQVQKLESGEILAGNLSARNLLSIADALGVDPRDLISADPPLKKQYVVPDPYRRVGVPPLYITGHSVRDAVLDSYERISDLFEHRKSDIRLVSVEFDPGIFGGTGGWVAKIECHDNIEDIDRILSAWIYADENGNPTR